MLDVFYFDTNLLGPLKKRILTVKPAKGFQRGFNAISS